MVKIRVDRDPEELCTLEAIIKRIKVKIRIHNQLHIKIIKEVQVGTLVVRGDETNSMKVVAQKHSQMVYSSHLFKVLVQV